jgi:hypothetical protein
MRTSIAVPAMLFALALSAGAQTKISGKLNCGKPDVNSSAEVPDVAGHMVALTKATCTWSTALEIEGAKTKSAVDVGVAEVHGSSVKSHGYNVSTMDNGDKVSVSYEGTATPNKDGSSTFKGTWKWISGTGKFKGIKGSGAYKGTQAADGAGMADVDGEYTLSAPSVKKGK